MIIDKKLTLSGTQAYTVMAGDILVIKIKNVDEFRYKVPDNWQGTITVNIKSELTEIVPT